MFIIFTHFQGILTSETRCLNCETVTSKDEEFCDLSIDVDQVGYQVSFQLLKYKTLCCRILQWQVAWETSPPQRLCAQTTNSNVIPAVATRWVVVLNRIEFKNVESWQEAHKRMRVKRLPTILALHLKRFKYVEQYNRHIKVGTNTFLINFNFQFNFQGFSSSCLPPRAASVQHLWWCCEPWQDVRPGGRGHSLWIRA